MNRYPDARMGHGMGEREGNATMGTQCAVIDKKKIIFFLAFCSFLVMSLPLVMVSFFSHAHFVRLSGENFFLLVIYTSIAMHWVRLFYYHPSSSNKLSSNENDDSKTGQIGRESCLFILEHRNIFFHLPHWAAP